MTQWNVALIKVSVKQCADLHYPVTLLGGNTCKQVFIVEDITDLIEGVFHIRQANEKSNKRFDYSFFSNCFSKQCIFSRVNVNNIAELF